MPRSKPKLKFKVTQVVALLDSVEGVSYHRIQKMSEHSVKLEGLFYEHSWYSIRHLNAREIGPRVVKRANNA